ncbi:MAG: hypothetical protein JO302_04740 [Candidatus Eremiobacteraeota bacterium]|nr:hypothetical protein [Candidatus Eremiobacteraeota bacterium]
MSTKRFFLLATVAAFAVAACTPSQSLAPSAPGITTLRTGRSAGLSVRLRTFTAGKTPGFLASAVAWDIAAAPDGAIWFTDPATPAVGRIDATGRVREFSRGLAQGSHPFSIVAAPDANMWFSDSGTGAIGRITPSGSITEFGQAKLAGDSGSGIVAGADDAIWAIELVPASNGGFEPSALARVTTSGAVSTYRLPHLLADGSLAVDASGDLWFLAIKGRSVVLGERSPDGSLISHRTGLVPGAEPCCPNLAPKHLVIGRDGNPWFTTLYFASNNPKYRPNSLATFASGHATFYHLGGGHKLAFPVWPSGIASDGTDLWVSGASVFEVKGALFLVRGNGTHEVYGLDDDPIGMIWSKPAVWFTSQIDGVPSSIVQATVSVRH